MSSSTSAGARRPCSSPSSRVRSPGTSRCARPARCPSHAHVLMVAGLGVDPEAQGRGVGRALVEAAVAEARARGARKLTLRVLGGNVTARRLYERCGFVVEGVLAREFLLDGEYADDVFMALSPRSLRDECDPATGSSLVRVSITPDTKDWTWVLRERAARSAASTAAARPAGTGPGRRRGRRRARSRRCSSGGDATRQRPDPAVWSPLEYACHVRDVFRRFDARLRLMLTTADPLFENWDQDADRRTGRLRQPGPAARPRRAAGGGRAPGAGFRLRAGGWVGQDGAAVGRGELHGRDPRALPAARPRAPRVGRHRPAGELRGPGHGAGRRSTRPPAG